MKRSFILFMLVLTIVICAGKMAIADGITISASPNQLQTGEFTTITVSAPNADALRLYQYREHEEPYLVKEIESSELQHSVSFSYSTTVYFLATARYNGVWSDDWSETQAVSFIAPSRNLEPVSYSYKVSGTLLTVTVQPVANAEEYFVAVGKKDESLGFISLGYIVRDTAGDFVFQLKGDGKYSVAIHALATGWNQSDASIEIQLTLALCGENVTWSLSEAGTLTISGTGDMFSYYDEQVPWDMSAVKKVVVESGVTRVGGCAFMGAGNLTEVQLPAGLKRIGQRAFNGCSSLGTIALPAGLESIGANAFAGSGLTEIDIPEGIENIGFGTFSFCGSLARVSLPASLTRIGQNAFMVCSNLTTLVLPQGVRFIGENAFDYCDIVLYGYSGSPAANLGVPFFTLDQNILTLPANTAAIESEAFVGLGAAVIVEIPATVTTIAPDAFNDSTVAFRCAEGSLAADYAAEHGIPVVPD